MTVHIFKCWTPFQLCSLPTWNMPYLKLERKPKAVNKNSGWVHWPETYSVSLCQSQCLVVTPNKEVKQKTLFLIYSMVQWFTLGIKVYKSSHAIRRFRFEPEVKYYSCSAQRTRRPAHYRGSKCMWENPCTGQTLPLPTGKAKWQNPSPPCSRPFLTELLTWSQQTWLPHS